MYLEHRFHCCLPLVDAKEKRQELNLLTVPLSCGTAAWKSASGRWCWESSQSLIPELSLVLLVRRPTHFETTDVHASLVIPPHVCRPVRVWAHVLLETLSQVSFCWHQPYASPGASGLEEGG